MSPACACGRDTIRRAAGWWCTYCHKTVAPAKPAKPLRQSSPKPLKAQTHEERLARRRAYYARNREKLCAYQREYVRRQRAARKALS